MNAIDTDLSKADIRSPIVGVVLERKVETGQTVAASFQAPVLFIIAEDLRRMELQVDVDEADVSRVAVGQDATFTVDAYPSRRFPAKVKEVRFASKTVEGVVTYGVVLTVDNAELLLRPGMTATADVTVETIENALLVPNAAFRFTPPNYRAAAAGRGGLVGMLLPRFRRSPSPAGPNASKEPGGKAQRVWTLRDAQPVPIRVVVGSTDGSRTVVVKGDLEEGVPLLIDVLTGNEAKAGS